MSTFIHERLIASLAIQRASILTKKVLSIVNKGALSKADSSPVTIADFAAQALLICAIHTAFPSDQFVGEENADALRKDGELRKRVWDLVDGTRLEDEEGESLLGRPDRMEEMLGSIDLGLGNGGREGRVWMLDPVDGTKTFMEGKQYAVSLALVVDGVQVLGVLGCPNLDLGNGRVSEEEVDGDGLGWMLSAVKGEGAYIRPMGRGGLMPAKKIERPDGPNDLKDLHFVDYTNTKTYRANLVHRVAGRFGAEYPGTEVWSSHMRYTALIVGGGDAYVRIPRKRDTTSYVWDHAGAQLIFTEVGGKITDLEGKEFDFGAGRTLGNNWGMVAASKNIHETILKAVTEILNGVENEV